MKPVLTPAEAAELDRATQAGGVRQETLMDRAGYAVARAVLDVTGGAYGRRAVVLRGKGNNGGDGEVAAARLRRWGMRVAIIAVPGGDLATITRELGRADVVIDAIVGTGFRGAAEGAMAAVIDAMNAAPCPVVAIDIPSGVDGATGVVAGPAVSATLTVAFGAPKAGTVLMPGAELAGDVRVVDIGFLDDLVPLTTGLTEPADVDAAIVERGSDAHKKTSGVVVVVAGSRGMTGAARLVAGAAQRTGAGYVVVAAPASALASILADVPEAVGLPLPETGEGTIAADAVAAVLERTAEADVVALGPGLTTHPDTAAFVRQVVRESPAPMVLDADGLNAFEGDAAGLADRKADAVLTPHLGELGRLGFGSTDRLVAARDLAAVTQAVALIKGTRTVIDRSRGLARINPTGTPVLATAGTGDVLTGMIAGLVARGLAAYDAAWAGAYLHGMAGIFAGADRREGVVASEVADRVPEAIATIRRQGS